MNTLLNNPPSFLNAEDFSLQERNLIPNPEALDIFADLNWTENNNNNNNNDANNNVRDVETLIQEQLHQNPQFQTAQTTMTSVPPITTSDSLKKDIIKPIQ